MFTMVSAMKKKNKCPLLLFQFVLKLDGALSGQLKGQLPVYGMQIGLIKARSINKMPKKYCRYNIICMSYRPTNLKSTVYNNIYDISPVFVSPSKTVDSSF